MTVARRSSSSLSSVATKSAESFAKALHRNHNRNRPVQLAYPSSCRDTGRSVATPSISVSAHFSGAAATGGGGGGAAAFSSLLQPTNSVMAITPETANALELF
jgi:hypothetical protein